MGKQRYVVQGEVTWKVMAEVVVEAENEDEAERLAVKNDLLAEAAIRQLEIGTIDDEEIDVWDIRPAKD